jgi:hypothetical protein
MELDRVVSVVVLAQGVERLEDLGMVLTSAVHTLVVEAQGQSIRTLAFA